MKPISTKAKTFSGVTVEKSDFPMTGSRGLGEHRRL